MVTAVARGQNHIFGDELFPLVGKRHRNSLLRVRSYTAVAPIFISNSISCCQRYFLAAVKILTQAWISSIIALKTPISAEWLGISSALLLRVWHLLHEEPQPLFSQDLLHAPDGVTILIKQEANSL